MRFANNTIPNLTAAIDRMVVALEESPVWDSLPCEPSSNEEKSEWTRRQQQVGEIQRVLRWEPSELEILLYRALSRLHQEASGDSLEMTTTLDEALSEAFDALSIASHDFRNALAIHTYCIDGNERDEWNYKGDDRSP
jgi:hypothetical protein